MRLFDAVGRFTEGIFTGSAVQKHFGNAESAVFTGDGGSGIWARIFCFPWNAGRQRNCCVFWSISRAASSLAAGSAAGLFLSVVFFGFSGEVTQKAFHHHLFMFFGKLCADDKGAVCSNGKRSDICDCHLQASHRAEKKQEIAESGI